MSVSDRLVLNDASWERIAPLIFGRPDQKDSTGRDNRLFVEGVLRIVRTGSPWQTDRPRPKPVIAVALNKLHHAVGHDQQRHLVECRFSKLEQFPRVAIRYGKTARNYAAVVTLAAIVVWLG